MVFTMGQTGLSEKCSEEVIRLNHCPGYRSSMWIESINGAALLKRFRAAMINSGYLMKLLRWTCLFLAMLWARSGVFQAQTIADFARQERERRKAVESESTVSIRLFTGVTPAATAGSAPTTSVGTATANEKSKSTGPTDLQGHDENYWRPKFDAARLAVKRGEDNLKLLDLRVNQTFLMRRGWDRITALQTATHDRDVARKDLADAQQNLADLKNQLRQSGGFPGWSRPR